MSDCFSWIGKYLKDPGVRLLIIYLIIIISVLILAVCFPDLLHKWYLLYTSFSILVIFILSFCYSRSQINSSNSIFTTFLRIGIAFLITGLFATVLIIVIFVAFYMSFTNTSPITQCGCVYTSVIPEDIREHLSIFLQMSLNFLLAGVGLIGASLPVFQSLYRQSEHKAEPSPQSGGEGGSSQQNK